MLLDAEWIVERAKGIEPSYEAWEAAVLPLNYARSRGGFYCGDGRSITAASKHPGQQQAVGAEPFQHEFVVSLGKHEAAFAAAEFAVRLQE